MDKVCKERNYVYDAMRGFLMLAIVVKHLAVASGHCAHGTAEGTFAVLLEMMSLQGFFFLSGLFSKNVEKSRATAVKSLLWPYVMSFAFFWLINFALNGFGETAMWKIGSAPFGMWFLIVLFAYRFFLKDLIKVDHIFGISIVLLLVSGLFEWTSVDFWSFSRMITYLWSFLLGYFMSTEQVSKLRCLKWWQSVILGVFLVASSHLINIYCSTALNKVFQVKASYASLGVSWYEGMLFRLIGMVLSIGWIILFLNVFGKKKGFLAWLGANTMPMYLFHLLVRVLIVRYGCGFGIIPAPESTLLFWLYIIAISVAISCFAASKAGNWLYSLIFEKTYDLLAFLWKKINPVFAYVEKPFEKIRDKLN
ncbi:MAG: hypothetical protein MJ145_02220 [Clostridia bacterium]|nr:hypothetical protein [Clostridia bacterium]